MKKENPLNSDIINLLPRILEKGLAAFEFVIPGDIRYDGFYDKYEGVKGSPCNGIFIIGENLQIVTTLRATIAAGLARPADLIYIDPPFFTGSHQTGTTKLTTAKGQSIQLPTKSYSDIWGLENAGESNFEHYLVTITASLFAAHALLSETGSLWLHLDYRAVHYAKVIADAIFGGPVHLVNEVIWQYKSGGATKKRFARKHDTLLFYAKDPKNYKFYPPQEKSYNRDRKPYRFKGVKEYRDEEGWYTLVNMRDVWMVNMVGRTSAERTGYATQKPEELLKRIISSCTDEGDMVMDLFGGSGTTAAACEKLHRDWLLCDNSKLAALASIKRLVSEGSSFDLLRQVPLLNREELEQAIADENRTEEQRLVFRRMILPKQPQLPIIDVRLDKEPIVDSSKRLIRISILDYETEDEAIPTEEKFIEVVQDTAKHAPENLISMIAVAPGDENALFSPTVVSHSGKPLEFLVETSCKHIEVRIWDIFGNAIVKHFEI